jgi:hypothetical protein
MASVTETLEIQGYRVELRDNGDGTQSPVVASSSSAGDPSIEFQGFRIALSSTGNTVEIGEEEEPTYAVVVAGLGVPSGARPYFLQHTAPSPAVGSDLAMLATTDLTRTLQVITAPANGSVLRSWITPASSPNLAYLLQGLVTLHIHASIPAMGGHTYKIYGRLSEVDASGNLIGVIATTEATPNLTATELEYNLNAILSHPYYFASTSSRLLLDLIVQVAGSGATHNVTLYYGGTGGVPPDAQDVAIYLSVPASA